MCADCEARRKMARDALLSAKFGEAIKNTTLGVIEAAGFKKKTGGEELNASKAKAKPRKR